MKMQRWKILFQKSVGVTEDMTAQDIAKAVLHMEHRYYASIVEKFILQEQ